MARSFLTDFELMIVLAALRGGDEAYAMQIAREIESTAGRCSWAPSTRRSTGSRTSAWSSRGPANRPPSAAGARSATSE